MNLRKVLFLFCLWLISFVSSAQRTINGRIIDADDGAPIPGAAVFIANTTVGTTTDPDGYYQLKIPGEGSYQLAISHVAYQPVSRELESGKTSKVIDVTMRVYEFEEIVVAKKVKARKIDIDLFWRTLLGKKPSSKTIEVINPEAVYFYYNSDSRILTVTCRVPIEIVNHETGYHIQFVLKNFKHDYMTRITSWEG